MLRIDRLIKPWKEAAALSDHINLFGFWNERTFLTKSGDLGMVLRVQGVDYESLDREEQEYAVKRLEAALKSFGPGFHIYQYLIKTSRPEIPFAHYDDPVVEAAVEQRRSFFAAKLDSLYQIEIFYVVLLEGSRSKRGLAPALAMLFSDPAGALGELASQFSQSHMKTLLRNQIETNLTRLEQRVEAFSRQLADFVQIVALPRAEQFTFFRRLLNYDKVRIAGRPQCTQFLDFQVVNSDIEAERDHLRVGSHLVRVYTQSEERRRDAPQLRAQEAVTYARDRTFEREAVIDERHIFRDALRRGMGETTYPQVRASFEARIASGEFQAVPGQKHDTGRQFTTQQTIRAEREVMRRLEQGQNQAPQIMSIQDAIALTEARQHLNSAQRSAIEQVLTSRDIIQGLQGSAGVGKTTALESVRRGAGERGYTVEGFAPTSRAAHQLRDAGLAADTLQGFLARAQTVDDPSRRHLYLVDESSLASTKQMRDFLEKIGPQDRVLLIGDNRQHQGVEAGKPFEQLVEAGMRTAQLNQIVRQKDPALLQAVEHLSRSEIAQGVAALQQQGRITEIAAPQQRIEAIAKNYAAKPENTIIVSPDNASRREINQAVRVELQGLGIVQSAGYAMRVLAPRSDMTGADRAWASRYQVGDVLRYQRGSKDIGIEQHSYTEVIATDPKQNLLTVQKADCAQITHDPSRLRGISAYREIELEFAVGDRLQFTAPSRGIGVANRDLGTIEQIGKNEQLSVRMDNGKVVAFDANQMRHFDHGYAVTSHSSQGITAERVLVNIDTNVHPDLINTRFAYVSVSRASHDAQIYTNNAASLVSDLSREVNKSSAVTLPNPPDNAMRQDLRESVGAPKSTDTAFGLGI